MAVRLGPLTDLFALVGPDALARLSRLGEESFGLVSLSFRHPRHWRNLSGPQARACQAREDRFPDLSTLPTLLAAGAVWVFFQTSPKSPSANPVAAGLPNRVFAVLLNIRLQGRDRGIVGEACGPAAHLPCRPG